MIRGRYLKISEQALNSIKSYSEYSGEDQEAHMNLGCSRLFRDKCVKAGYRLKKLYPIYYQGWDLDEWGALAVKNGQTYILETDHGSLTPRLQPSIIDSVKRLFSFLKG